VAVYGFASVGTDEKTGAINHFNDYGCTKWLAEEKYRTWLASDPENSLMIIRPTVIFGEQNRGNVYNLLRQIASGTFPLVGKGTNVKSMAYVENVSAFIEYNLNNPPGEYLFNYIDKEETKFPRGRPLK
jgi:nucleoside-diphosphate-sugar epimerase